MLRYSVFVFLVMLFLPAEALRAQVNVSKVDTPQYRKNKNFIQQTELYKLYRKKQATIVFLGNSITHGVNWNELLGRDDVIERGIPSDILEGMYARLDNILSLQPKVVFIMGGINDIYSNIPVEKIFTTYKEILRKLGDKGIKLVVQATLYVNPQWHNAEEKNKEVEKLNLLLRDYCYPRKIEYLDLNLKLSRDKQLRDEMTYDGVHLTPKAYQIWQSEADKILKKLNF